MRHAVFGTILVMLATASSGASNVETSNDELNGITRAMQIFDEVKKRGGEVDYASFESSGRNTAHTTIHAADSELNARLHQAILSPDTSGPFLFFKVRKACKQNRPQASLTDKFVRVDDQNVAVTVTCKPNPSEPNTLWQVYKLKSKDGLDYVLDRFGRFSWVLVDFGDGVVPFDTAGFERELEIAKEPVL